MKQYGKYLGIAGMVILGIFLSCLSAAAWGNMTRGKSNVMFYLENPISVEDAIAVAEKNREAAEEDPQEQEEKKPAFPFCIWGQKEDVLLSNENLSRIIRADAILLCGSPVLLFEDCRMPVQEDAGGCLVDEKAAWELFGDIQAVGKEISCEGNNYTIRNVVAGKEGIIAFQASKTLIEKNPGLEEAESGQSMDGVMQRITIQKPEGYSIHDLESVWNNTYGIFADVLDTELLRGIGGICMLLFPVSMCLFFGVYLYHQYAIWSIPLWPLGHFPESKKQKPFQGKAVTAGLMLVLAAMLLFFLKGQVKIPDDYIPTRWSEFSFWATLWETKIEAVKLLLRMPKSELDAGWMGDFFKTVACGLMAEMFLMIAGFWLQRLYDTDKVV